MVLLLPPAPAARVLVGRAEATLSARSAAAFLLMAVAGPPGGFGDVCRPVAVPVLGVLTGEVGRGEDCGKRRACISLVFFWSAVKGKSWRRNVEGIGKEA